ncbi:hypothetical protein, partial [Citreimonas salinaria]|uniref:hypothetical protein n=1 Tax=Citreimonas salinaria TaxID=321339 RepID=UPI001C42EA42
MREVEHDVRDHSALEVALASQAEVAENVDRVSGLRFRLKRALLRKGEVRDSSCESSVVAGLHEQTNPAELQ